MSYEKRGKVWRVNYRYNGVVYKETFDTEKLPKGHFPHKGVSQTQVNVTHTLVLELPPFRHRGIYN